MARTKRKIVGIKQLKKILNECAFDPKNGSKWKIVVDIVEPSYCETKALELIQEAKDYIKTGDKSNYKYDIMNAISLLALALVQRENENESFASKA